MRFRQKIETKEQHWDILNKLIDTNPKKEEISRLRRISRKTQDEKIKFVV